MSSLKFNFLTTCLIYSLLTISFPSKSMAMFTGKECLDKSLKVKTSHKIFPFGLFENILTVSKEHCVITIQLKKYKVFNSTWNIDVCREPIHIKKGGPGVEVLKRKGSCKNHIYKKEEYCLEVKKILEVIQENGLIFSSGERENINSDHGEVYCAFLLVKRYLEEGRLFYRSDPSQKISLFKLPSQAVTPNIREGSETELQKDSTPRQIPPSHKRESDLHF